MISSGYCRARRPIFPVSLVHAIARIQVNVEWTSLGGVQQAAHVGCCSHMSAALGQRPGQLTLEDLRSWRVLRHVNVDKISWVKERSRVKGQLRPKECNFTFTLVQGRACPLFSVINLKRVDVDQMVEGVVQSNVYSWVSRECRWAAKVQALKSKVVGGSA